MAKASGSDVISKEIDEMTVKVWVMIDQLKKRHEKQVEVVFKDTSLCVEAHLEVKGEGNVNFREEIKQLPGKIDPEACTKEIHDGQVILVLKKQKKESWQDKMRLGLEQAESSDSSD